MVKLHQQIQSVQTYHRLVRIVTTILKLVQSQRSQSCLRLVYWRDELFDQSESLCVHQVVLLQDSDGCTLEDGQRDEVRVRILCGGLFNQSQPEVVESSDIIVQLSHHFDELDKLLDLMINDFPCPADAGGTTEM